jgi:uncharacterized membrane protein YsdA (DUF1294 family)
MVQINKFLLGDNLFRYAITKEEFSTLIIIVLLIQQLVFNLSANNSSNSKPNYGHIPWF